MTRTDADSWDLASSVGATATMVAEARALASKETDALISDPYAEPLVRAVGIDFFTKLVDGSISPDDVDDGGAARMMTTAMAVRTRFFDDFFLDATGAASAATSSPTAGLRQAVILASGLDSRAYRLPWPDGTVVFELDQPQVIAAKTATMKGIGAAPTADLRIVAVDLRDDWPAALREAGFDATLPTAWTAEGLLVYLPPEAQQKLLDDVSALSAPGSRFATEYHPDGGRALAARSGVMNDAWSKHGFEVKFDDLIYKGERTPVTDSLAAHGWQVETRSRSEMFERYGRVFPDVEGLAPMRASLSVTAIKGEG